MSDIIEQAVEIINRVAWVSTDETIGNPSEVVYALRDAGLLAASVEYGRRDPGEPALIWKDGANKTWVRVRRYVTEWVPVEETASPEVELARKAIQAQMNRAGT